MPEKFPVRRIVMDGLLIALFYALSLFSIEGAGVKLSFASLPVVIGAMAFGPLDGFLIGFLGEFCSQMLHYGFTVTTVLWLLPPALRGLVIGFGTRIFRRKLAVPEFKRKLPLYYAVCLFAAVVTSAVNTPVYYIDSKLFGYYSYALVFGAALTRLLTNLLNSAITASIAIPILLALYKARLIPSQSTKKEEASNDC